jgi:hypothetical protein
MLALAGFILPSRPPPLAGLEPCFNVLNGANKGPDQPRTPPKPIFGLRKCSNLGVTGKISEWLKESDCKSDGSAFAGSNPALPIPWHIRGQGVILRLVVEGYVLGLAPSSNTGHLPP